MAAPTEPPAQPLTQPPLQASRWRMGQWLAWGGLPLLGLLLALWLQSQPPQRDLFLGLNHWAAAYPAGLWAFFTLLGEAGVLFVVLSPLLLWRPQALLAAMAAAPVGGLFSVIFKRLYEAPRPAAVLDVAQFQVIGPLLHNLSFPSGHTLTAFAGAVAVLTTLASPRAVGRSVSAAAVVLGLAAMTGFSRVAVGAHWPVDVLAGACAGALAGLSGAWLVRRYPALWQNRRNQRVLGGGLLATALWLLWQPSDYPQGELAIWLAAGCAVVTVGGQFKAWRQEA